MSQKNVEVVTEFMSLFKGGDRERWRDYFDPDVIWERLRARCRRHGRVTN